MSDAQAQLNGAIHNALAEILGGQPAVNSSSALDSGVRQRMAAMLSGGYDFADTLHNIYLDFGYPPQLSFYNFWNMYRRLGVAKRGVELYPSQTWLDDPIVTSKNAGFNRDLRTLIGTSEDGELVPGGLGLWRRMKGLDTRQRVGRYAGMFMRVRDGKSPDQPLEGTLSGLKSLVEMTPLYESQLQVLTTDNDEKSDTFGQPTMYQFSSSVAGNRNEKAGSSFQIHPSRIVIAAEGSDNGGIYGISSLEAPYNSLMDLRKVIGGGGEGFYKNAAQSIVFDLKDASTANANAALLKQFNENYDDFAQNRSRRSIWTPGMEAKTLDSNLVNPKEFAANALLDIAAGFDVPVALLTGNQTGRLAGDQDTKGFLGQVQARRTDFGTDMVVNVIDWLMQWGILPKTPYSVEWPDAQAPSSEQKLDNADKMATINEKQFKSGGDEVFSAEEIREAAGSDPEEVPEPDADLDDEGDLDDET